MGGPASLLRRCSPRGLVSRLRRVTLRGIVGLPPRPGPARARRRFARLRRIRVPGPAALLRRFGMRTRLRSDRVGRIVHASLIVEGIVLGLILALPVHPRSGSCLPGDGHVLCMVQKAWLPSILLFLATVLAAHLLSSFLLVRVPVLWRKWHAGERPTRRPAAQEAPPYSQDPFLLAASWGVKTGRREPPVQPTPMSLLRRRDDEPAPEPDDDAGA